MLIDCFLRCESSPCFVLCYRILFVLLNDAFTMCCMWHMRCASRMTVQEGCKEQCMVHISEFPSLQENYNHMDTFFLVHVWKL
jgi:hypothetical protein